MRRAVSIILGLTMCTAGMAAAKPVDVALGRGDGLLAAADIARAVEHVVLDAARQTGEACSVRVYRTPDTVHVGRGSIALRIALPGPESLRGLLSLPVEIRVGGRMERRISVSVVVRTYAEVVVAARRLLRHRVLGPDDTKTDRVETTLLRDGMLTGAAVLGGKRTRRIIAQGSVLYPWMLEHVPIVRAGEEVRLVVRAGSVILSAPGIAKQDGTPGDRILVQKQGTHDRLRGTVADDGSVEIAAK